jgi:hypothetical protein
LPYQFVAAGLSANNGYDCGRVKNHTGSPNSP